MIVTLDGFKIQTEPVAWYLQHIYIHTHTHTHIVVVHSLIS
jgi:hypothetical protein